ncbi:MAG TPA: TAXI family TRAP transporter solute-binding subunit [Limnochordales bacterium]|nr:TAXI family TRAP transporter solute-binding subunit [Limnochordales bacterium]
MVTRKRFLSSPEGGTAVRRGVLQRSGRWSSRLIILLAVAALLAACGPRGTQSPSATTPAQSGSSSQSSSVSGSSSPQVKMPQFLTIGTAGSGGAYYPIGIAMAQILTDHLNTQATAQVTGGAVENIRLVEEGSVEMAITQARTAFAGYNGGSPYTQPHRKVRAMFANLSQGIFQVVVMADSPIRTLADLKGKRVVMGPAGGAAIDIGRELFELAGFTLEDVRATYVSYDEGISQLKDGAVDAVIVQAAMPSPAIQQLAASRQSFRLLSLDDAFMDEAIAKYPYYSKVHIPTDVYGAAEPATTLMVSNMVIVGADLDDDVVYTITKTLLDNIEAIRESHPAARDLTLEGAAAGVPIPFHPGAERYLREKGVLQ